MPIDDKMQMFYDSLPEQFVGESDLSKTDAGDDATDLADDVEDIHSSVVQDDLEDSSRSSCTTEL